PALAALPPAAHRAVHRVRAGRRPDDRGRGRGRARRLRWQRGGADRPGGVRRLAAGQDARRVRRRRPAAVARRRRSGRRNGGSGRPHAMNVILRWLLDLLFRLVRTLDLPLLAALAALMAIGLAVLYSAGGQSTSLVVAQGA